MPTIIGLSASPSPAPDKEKLFYLLAYRGALSYHSVGVIPAGRTSQKSLGRSCKIGLSPLPTTKPYSLPLTHNPTMSHIGWVQAGGVWASRVLSLLVCPKSTYRSCICRGLEACLHGLPPFFILIYGLFYNSLLTLGARLPLILGFTFLPAYFLIVVMSCHVTLSFLL